MGGQIDPDVLVTLLVRAHVERRHVTLPNTLTERQARAIQAGVVARRGGAGAWKVGRADGAISFSAIPRDILHYGDSRLSRKDYSMMGIEVEIAFKLLHPVHASEALPPQSRRAELIGPPHFAIELLDTRLEDWRQASPEAMLADGMGSGALIIGGPAVDVLDLAQPGVALFVDGEERVAPGHNPSGDPTELAVALVEHCHAADIDLQECWITTGSSTGCCFLGQLDRTIAINHNDKDVLRILFSE